ncbi:MAG: DUF2911 domain-containing protein [Bacteroidetes bacterium]|nr:DUF2911 domain-containing protein [Bacteroidota bacterium]MBS1541625.1 DUF2911 domain-containing protein [Bacteroidota bacterium]
MAFGQIKTPSPSPAGSVSTTVGLTDVKIDYSRPRVKGRKIFGEGAGFLLPYGTIWRSGANNGTFISFSDDVTVEGNKVPAGKYLIYTWPGASEWTVSLYKDINLGGDTEHYDKAQELINFKVKSEKLAEKVETLTYNIGDIADDSKSAKVQLAWENTSVKFSVGVDFDAKVMKSIEASTKINPNNYYQAAVYYLENGKDLKQAEEWAVKASEASPDAFWIWYQRARIEKALGNKAAALASSKKSSEKAAAAKNRDYVNMNEELQKSLK